jgi:preflagellin peptidase FlaK
MSIVEYILLLLLAGTGIVCSITDLKFGYIYNKYLVVPGIAGLVLDIIYYGFFVRELLPLALENIGIVIVIEMLFYRFHVFAGGDLKLGILLAILYPAGCYISYGQSSVTYILALGGAILFAYVFLLVSTIKDNLQKKRRVPLECVKNYLLKYLYSYCRAFLYTMCVILSFASVSDHINIVSWIVWLSCIAVALMSRRINWMQRRGSVAAVAAADIILIFVTKKFPFSFYPETYLLAAIVIILQMIISSGLYEEIPTDEVTNGMILSMVSSMRMQNSRVKGLPGISTEDLRSRLTQEEAENVKRWAKTKTGSKTVTIMKKVPFAVFLVAGVAVYYFAWSILR